MIDRNTKPDNTQITLPHGGSMTLQINSGGARDYRFVVPQQTREPSWRTPQV